MPLIANQQLFSEAYLRELRMSKMPAGVSAEAVCAVRQTVRDWRDEYSQFDSPSTLRRYVGQCLSTLGLSYSPRPDGFTLFADDSFGAPVGLVLVVDDPDLGRATKGRHHQHNLVRELRNASLHWGMITNGAHWRLCHATATAPYELFLQADLDALLRQDDLTDFSLYYRFFGREAFTLAPLSSPNGLAGAGRQRAGLDLYAEESERRVDVIQRHLRARVEPILQSLCLGFVQDEAAVTYSRETLDEIYRNSIYLLYRVLFLFYAEARDLMPVGNPLYDEASLAAILQDAYKRQQEGLTAPDPFSLWKRLTRLFVLVDDGDESLGVRPYNGGLFSDTEKPYLKAHKIADAYLAPAIFELGYAQTKAGSPQPIDYRDLSVRQLGTLYEGLLEYRLNLVEREPVIVRESGGKRLFIPQSEAGTVKKNENILEVGQVYFADDKGERKQSGSYYTPEDVVQYIVTNTVGPKLAERRAPLDALIQKALRERDVAPTPEERVSIERYADQVAHNTVDRDILGLRILDPAMGSAHFLVAAGQMVTDAIVETLNSTPWPNDGLSTDPLTWKRRVVERCLYGVDLNPLAQELAKLALWISSASAGKPLTFLDHHLKVGNSLYGAPLSRLLALPTSKRYAAGMRDMFVLLYQRAVIDALRQVSFIINTESHHIEDVKQKSAAHQRASDNIVRPRDILNVLLAALFGIDGSKGGSVDILEYSGLLDDLLRNYAPEAWESKVENTRVLREARSLAKTNSFFLWEFEFPDAIPDISIDDLDTVAEIKCEFDVVIGNPPYVGTTPNLAITSLYKTAKCRDKYAWFFEQALHLTGAKGAIGMIVPMSIMFSREFKALRSQLLEAEAESYIATFDATRDGIFPPSAGSRNGQRASIVIQRKRGDGRRIFTTNMMRWLAEERANLLPALRYSDVTVFATEERFPKLGDEHLAAFWRRASSFATTVGSTTLSRKKNTQPDGMVPDRIPYNLYISGSARYFITAMPNAMRETGLNLCSWTDEWTRDIAMVALNSNIFYWLWYVMGDGFHVTSDNIEAMVLPEVRRQDRQTLRLRDALLNAADECVTYQIKWGERIPNYNFNRRMDILLDIDDWIVKHVAPDLDLPRDIFAQYKSNSFLRPLDLSALMGEEADMAEAL